MEANVRYTHQVLVEQSKEGNRNAQYQLYGLYVDAMFNVAMRLLTVREDAEDILQESFVEAFKKLDTFRFESTFGAWLKRIVINRSINHLKAKRLLLSSLENEAEPVEDDNAEIIPEMEIEKVKIGMGQLPEGYKQIITLYLIEGYDHVEIGEILDISTSTSKSQYHRAKKKLIQIVNEL
ncbi:RNA polymerase sigma factor [Flagellimonas pacifica]|uniref:RNA polymerase sigma factor n=1 Tax=Flagellimonas pacifica TaxID=1247520 RepID=A0A285ME40_9FLAO|nr:RNA polymerase sigma factor [Allomuricauda parva]SNY95442.1 RNA polymerase sigma-70 factor, ECF subfamily [Allomuricauda parva]